MFTLSTTCFLLILFAENGKASGGSQLNHIASSGVALFNTRNNTRVIAQRGGLAVLPCAVKLNPSATVRKYIKQNLLLY